MSENNITITNVVNVPQQSRGAGTVLMLVFFCGGLPMRGGTCWRTWIGMTPIAAIVNIWDAGFFARTWYQPWSVWMFGIR